MLKTNQSKLSTFICTYLQHSTKVQDMTRSNKTHLIYDSVLCGICAHQISMENTEGTDLEYGPVLDLVLKEVVEYKLVSEVTLKTYLELRLKL